MEALALLLSQFFLYNAFFFFFKFPFFLTWVKILTFYTVENKKFAAFE